MNAGKMNMELCGEWLDTEAKKKFGELSAREELIALEFAAWLNKQFADVEFKKQVEENAKINLAYIGKMVK